MNTHKLSGFTLIEVLLALAIIAISLTALLIATSQDINQTQRLKNKMLENWVAKNTYNEIQLGKIKLPVKPMTTYKTNWLNQACYWRVLQTKTQFKNIYRIAISTSLNHAGPYTESLTGYWMDK